MTTNKDKNNKAARHGNRVVHDRQGTAYELTGKLAEGGQGVVCQTQFKNVLVKIGRHPANDPRTKAWFDHMQWVSRLPLLTAVDSRTNPASTAGTAQHDLDLVSG